MLSTQRGGENVSLTSLQKHIKIYDAPSTTGKPRSCSSPLQATLKDLLILTYLGQPTFEKIPYLGSHLSQKATFEADIQHRICCASTSFRKRRNQGFDNHNLRKDTKVMAYNAFCIDILLYGSEAWVTHRCHLKTFDKFHQSCLIKTLCIR